MTKQKQVFLSYASEDLQEVRKLYEALKARNVRVWFDKVNLKPGKWKPQIKRAITHSSYFVICLSPAALRKTGEEPGFQDEELSLAFEIALAQDERSFVILPVRLENVGRGDHRLSMFQQYDLFEDWQGTVDKLVGIFSETDPSISANLINDRLTEEQIEEQMVIRALHGKAAVFYYAGYYEKALSMINSIEVIEGETLETINDEGATHHALGHFEEALAAFDKALSIESNHAIIWANKGNALRDLERYNEAVAAFDKAISISPTEQMWYEKGKIFIALCNADESLIAFDKAISMKPDFANAHVGRAIVLSLQRRHSEVLAAAKAAIEIKPDIAFAHLYKGKSLIALGDYNQAILDLEKALSIDPHDTEALTLYTLVSLLLVQKSEKKALEVLDALLTINPDDIDYHMGWYFVLLEAKRYDEAITVMNTLLSIYPNDARLWYEKGVLMETLGRTKDALSSYETSMKINPNDPLRIKIYEFKK